MLARICYCTSVLFRLYLKPVVKCVKLSVYRKRREPCPILFFGGGRRLRKLNLCPSRPQWRPPTKSKRSKHQHGAVAVSEGILPSDAGSPLPALSSERPSGRPSSASHPGCSRDSGVQQQTSGAGSSNPDVGSSSPVTSPSNPDAGPSSSSVRLDFRECPLYLMQNRGRKLFDWEKAWLSQYGLCWYCKAGQHPAKSCPLKLTSQAAPSSCPLEAGQQHPVKSCPLKSGSFRPAEEEEEDGSLLRSVCIDASAPLLPLSYLSVLMARPCGHVEELLHK